VVWLKKCWVVLSFSKKEPVGKGNPNMPGKVRYLVDKDPSMCCDGLNQHCHHFSCKKHIQIQIWG
jgi:hypothetical protein